jgi:hypothetical protein
MLSLPSPVIRGRAYIDILARLSPRSYRVCVVSNKLRPQSEALLTDRFGCGVDNGIGDDRIKANNVLPKLQRCATSRSLKYLRKRCSGSI